MRTTLAINAKLLNEAKALSIAKTKKEAVEVAFEEFIRRRKANKLLELKGRNTELSFTLEEFLKNRKEEYNAPLHDEGGHYNISNERKQRSPYISSGQKTRQGNPC